MRLLGSFAPAWNATSPLVADLARLNMYAYVCLVLQIAGQILGLVTDILYDSYLGVLKSTLVNLIGLAMLVVLWLAARERLAQQVRLAANACVVLRIMTCMAAPASRSASVEQLSALTSRDTLLLLKELAWLPAYDRRDVLVVQELLARSRPDLRPSEHIVHALTLCAYLNARLNPSVGDASARDLALNDWLSERDMNLDGGVVARGDLVAASSSPSSSPTVHLTELRQLGCFIYPGVLSALVTPLGALPLEKTAASPTSQAQWMLYDTSNVRSARVACAIGHYLWTFGAQSLGYVHVFALKKGWVGMTEFNALQLALRSLQIPAALWLLFVLAYTDAVQFLRGGRVALPLVSRDGPIANLVVAAFWGGVGFVFSWYASRGFVEYSCEVNVPGSCALASVYAVVNLFSVAPVAAVSAYQAVFVLAVAATQLWFAQSLRTAQLGLSPEAYRWTSINI